MREALALAGQRRPEIVVLDVGMPKLDGCEVARRIRAESWGRDAVALARPGRAHSIYIFWREGTFEHWYVNFEEPLRRTPVGFDTFDHKLDLIVMPDGAYRWKDEDEFEQAAALGLLDADAVRAEAARVLEEWPFPTGWEDWRPDPAWPVPQLPDGWDRV